MDRDAAIARIKAIIEDQNGIVVADDDGLLEIDSMTILIILTFARESLGIELDTEKLDFDDFASLATIEEVLFSGRFLSGQVA